MKHLSVFAVFTIMIILASCEKKEYTNMLSGTIWEGTEISKEMWDDQLGFPPDTTYHRLEFLEWSDRKVHHYYLSRYDGEWHGRGVFNYEMTESGRIRMEWEITYYGDTLTRWFDVSDDMMQMTSVSDFYKIRLKQIK